MINITGTFLKAFFGEFLLGVENPILDGPSKEWPDVDIVGGSDI